MDIIRKIKPIKASFENLSLKHRLLLIIILVSLVSVLIPHESVAQAQPPEALFFVLGDHEEFIAAAGEQALLDYEKSQREKQVSRNKLLAEKLKEYLRSYNSPLADHAIALVHTKNWKQIIALSNAESNMCKKYPVSTNNCWGVGGSELWDMGDNLSQGAIAMDNFLTHYPKRSKVKYYKMTFDQMNGLYKQPAADHWVVNTQTIFDELTKLEQSI